MKPLIPTAVDERILLALGQYRLLTIAQMERLRISDRKSLGERLKRLATAGYTDSVRGSPQSPGVHWLTSKAAKHYSGRFGESWARSASTKGFSDGPYMEQRLATIDACISLRAWLEKTGGNLASLRTDFDAAAGLHRATTLEHDGIKYTPDALAEITDASGAPWVFALEIETGGFQKRLDNFTEKLPHRIEVMQKRCMDKALKRPIGSRAARMMFVFGSADMLQRALKALPHPAARHWQGVYFKALPDVVESFGEGWICSTGEAGKPFL